MKQIKLLDQIGLRVSLTPIKLLSLLISHLLAITFMFHILPNQLRETQYACLNFSQICTVSQVGRLSPPYLG
jgi:hypothetical protein